MRRGSSLRRMLLPTRVSGLLMVVAILCARLSRSLDCADYVLISGAPAEISFQTMPDLVVGWVRIIRQQLFRAQDHARRAEAALQPVLVPERLLYGVEFAVGGQS